MRPVSPGSQRTAACSCSGSQAHSTPRADAISPARRRSRATAQCRSASSGWRTSTIEVGLPGITFATPGETATSPTVATRPGVWRATASTSPTVCAAAASASRRSSIGTVPAWPVAAAEAERGTRLPGDAGHDAQRQPPLLEHRSLLDVELGVADQRARLARAAPSSAAGVAAEAADGVLERHAVVVEPRERGPVEAAGEHGAARGRPCRSGSPPRPRTPPPRARTEAGAPFRCSRSTDRDRREHAERAVVAPRVGHRVEVRAEQEGGRAGLGAVDAPDDVPDRVAANGHAGRSHPVGDQLAGIGECGGAEAAREPAALLAAARQQPGAGHRVSCHGRCCTPRARRAAARDSSPWRRRCRSEPAHARGRGARPRRMPCASKYAPTSKTSS